MGANHRRDENREHPMSNQTDDDQTTEGGKGPRDRENATKRDRRGSRTQVSGGSGALAERPSRPGPHARRRARAGVAGVGEPAEGGEVVVEEDDEEGEVDEEVLEVPVGRDEFGRPVELVVAESPTAATHWDDRLWERRS
jgi:hypothetical protein